MRVGARGGFLILFWGNVDGVLFGDLKFVRGDVKDTTDTTNQGLGLCKLSQKN